MYRTYLPLDSEGEHRALPIGSHETYCVSIQGGSGMRTFHSASPCTTPKRNLRSRCEPTCAFRLDSLRPLRPRAEPNCSRYFRTAAYLTAASTTGIIHGNT